MKKILSFLIAVAFCASSALAAAKEDKVDKKIDTLKTIAVQNQTNAPKQPLCVMCDFFSDREEYTEVFKWRFKNGKRELVETIHSIKGTPEENAEKSAASVLRKETDGTPTVENYYIGALPVEKNVLSKPQETSGIVPMTIVEQQSVSTGFLISILSLMLVLILTVLVFAWLTRKLYSQFLSLSADQKKILTQQTSMAKRQNDFMIGLHENDFDLILERDTSDVKKGDYTFTAKLYLRNNSGHAIKLDRITMEHDHLNEHAIERTASKSAVLYMGKILPMRETLQTAYTLKMYELDKALKENGGNPLELSFTLHLGSLSKSQSGSKITVSFNPDNIDETVALGQNKALIKDVGIKEVKTAD